MKDDSRDRILDVAIDLASEGGFDNVRQRDVAANAGVALGTLYKRFRSKEDILVAAVARQSGEMEEKLRARPIEGRTALDRVTSFFQFVTRSLCRRPGYGKSVLRAMASTEPEVTAGLKAHQGRMNRQIIAAIRGPGAAGCDDLEASEEEQSLAGILQQIWFSTLVIGWANGFVTQAQVVEHMRTAASLLLRGAGKK